MWQHAFDVHSEPILLYELRRCEGMLQRLGCAADVGNVNKFRANLGFSYLCDSLPWRWMRHTGPTFAAYAHFYCSKDEAKA